MRKTGRPTMLDDHAFEGRRAMFVVALLAALALIAGALASGADPASAGKKKKCAPTYTKVKVKGKLKCLPAPGIRATLTWTNGTLRPVDLDLVAWDPAGNRDGGLAVG